jgi:hypothetical protein
VSIQLNFLASSLTTRPNKQEGLSLETLWREKSLKNLGNRMGDLSAPARTALHPDPLVTVKTWTNVPSTVISALSGTTFSISFIGPSLDKSVQKITPLLGKPCWRGKLSTVDLLVPISLELFFIFKYYLLFYKTSYPNEEVNGTEPEKKKHLNKTCQLKPGKGADIWRGMDVLIQ